MTPENLNDWIDLCRVQGLKLQAQADLIRMLGDTIKAKWDRAADDNWDGWLEVLAAYAEWLKGQNEKT